jgi:hypothetical protein
MKEKIAIRLIETDRLTLDQMLKIGKKANRWRVWEAITKKIKWEALNIEQILAIGEKAKNDTIWEAVLEAIENS